MSAPPARHASPRPPGRRASEPRHAAALDDVIQAAELRASLRRFARESEQIAAEHGLTAQRYLLLLMIKGAPDGSERSTVTELTGRLQLAQHTVTELVSRAVRAGLIERERSREDRRVSHLRLTDEGTRRLMGAFRGHRVEREALRKVLDSTTHRP